MCTGGQTVWMVLIRFCMVWTCTDYSMQTPKCPLPIEPQIMSLIFFLLQTLSILGSYFPLYAPAVCFNLRWDSPWLRSWNILFSLDLCVPVVVFALQRNLDLLFPDVLCPCIHCSISMVPAEIPYKLCPCMFRFPISIILFQNPWWKPRIEVSL